jgi:hypothetical protein
MLHTLYQSSKLAAEGYCAIRELGIYGRQPSGRVLFEGLCYKCQFEGVVIS